MARPRAETYDETRRGILDTPGTSGTRDGADLFRVVSLQKILALDDELVVQGHDDEEVQRTGIHTVPAGGA